MNLQTCIALVMGRRWLTILLSLLAILAFAAGAEHIVSVDVDVRNHFNKDDPHILALDHLEETYAISDTALVAVAPQDGTIFTQDALVAVEELTEQLWLVPYVTRVDSIANYSHSEAFEDDLVVEPLVDDASSLSDDDIARIERIALETEEVAGRFVSRDGRVAGLFLSIALPEDRQERQQAKIEVVDALYDTAAEARAKYSSIDYHITGELPLNRAMSDALNEEFGLLGPIALGTMLLVAIVLLRSIWGTVAIVLMIVAVLLTALGFAGWSGMTFFGESAAAIFVLMADRGRAFRSRHRGYAGGAAPRNGSQAGRHSFDGTQRLACFLDVDHDFNWLPQPQFLGNASVPGHGESWWRSARFAPSSTPWRSCPRFLSYMPLRIRPAREGKRGLFRSPGAVCRFQSYVILLCSFARTVFVALMAGISRVELKENWLELLGESYEFRQSTDFISENYTGVEAFEYSLNTGQESGVTDVEYLRQVDAFAEWYRSAAERRPRIRHLRHHETPEQEPEWRRSGISTVSRRTPSSPHSILLLYEFSLPVGLDLNNLIDVERSATRMTVVLGSLSTNEKIELDDRAQEWLRQNAPGLETGSSRRVDCRRSFDSEEHQEHADRHHHGDGHRLVAPGVHFQERSSWPDQFDT